MVRHSGLDPVSSTGQAPESRVSGENRDPVFAMVPDFRREGVWIPASLENSLEIPPTPLC